MATRPEAYVDTSAFIAYLDRSDSHHPRFKRAFSDPPRLLTTPLVIAEGHAWFLKRYDASRALQFLGFVDSLTPLRIEEVGDGELEDATHYVRKFLDQGLTLADALGLALMRRRGIKSCWSTDARLALTGVRLLVHE